MKLRNKKTGEIKIFRFPHYEWGDDDKQYTLNIFDYDGNEYNYNTLAELNAEWEDYKEPLIKDEKIRKAVRAWAEAECIEKCYYRIPDTFESIERIAKIEFGVFGFNEGLYTITELCGEGKE